MLSVIREINLQSVDSGKAALLTVPVWKGLYSFLREVASASYYMSFFHTWITESINAMIQRYIRELYSKPPPSAGIYCLL